MLVDMILYIIKVFTICGILDRAMYPSDGLTRVVVKVLLKEGSSKQGKAALASVGWNLEVAIDLYENIENS